MEREEGLRTGGTCHVEFVLAGFGREQLRWKQDVNLERLREWGLLGSGGTPSREIYLCTGLCGIPVAAMPPYNLVRRCHRPKSMSRCPIQSYT